MAVVVFNPAAFTTQYPEFAGLATASLTSCFNTATLFCNNTDQSVVQDTTVRTNLLWLLTAHIAKLTLGTNDGAGNIRNPTDLVGRIEVAKEGSVDVRTDMGPSSATAAWYNQTQYGAMYFAASVRYRGLFYVPKQPTVMAQQGSTPALWPWGRW
ncbi:MAG TPA: DUF4054 domain-containing protein [Anaerolineae bacterium]|nr:DUF4054 domain-containing protein [Anaerolineae bacterium]